MNRASNLGSSGEATALLKRSVRKSGSHQPKFAFVGNMPKNFRKRKVEDEATAGDNVSDDEEERRLALEEVKLLQKQRERKSGIPANPKSQSSGVIAKLSDKVEGDGEKEELVLQDTFAQETAVMVEDPNMLKYIDQELAKKRGKNINAADHSENELKHAEEELYKIPDHLRVKKRNSEESSTQWTTGIAEVQLPIEYKLKNIEETEAAKKLLHEKRFVGKPKTDSSSPWSHNADYFQRGKDYAEKLRREHPELYKDRGPEDHGMGSRPGDNNADHGRRLAATDEFMLERFRKRERQRVMRR